MLIISWVLASWESESLLIYSIFQSCSSALSGGVKSIDGYLDDGIKDQSLSANPVTREMASHHDMQEEKGKEVLPKKNASGNVSCRFLIDAHTYIDWLLSGRQVA